MLSHCYTPTSFCVSTMIPIPKKGSGSMNDIRNYTGIALSSLLSKLFDHCIICNHYDSLRSDDLQFAYKSKISAIHCVNSVNEQLIITSITQVKFMYVHWMPLRHLIGLTY